VPRPHRLSTAARAVLVFCLVYLPILAGWIAFKHYYTHPLACTGAKLAALSTDAELAHCHYSKGSVNATFVRIVVTPAGVYPAHSGVVLDDNRYTFNVPITLAMLIVTTVLMRISWRAWSKALAALILGHLLYTYACFLFQLGFFKARIGGVIYSSTPPVAVQLFWDFCRSMLIRFEPFLILAVLILVHSLTTAKNKAGEAETSK